MTIQKASQKRLGLLPGLFFITILYFSLGFVSILFALSAFACMALPFILLAINKEKVWCHSYCPRASLITLTGKKRNWKPVPKQLTMKKLQNFMLWYFGLNLLFITGSTTQIALGNMESMEYIRLFIAIPLFELPQLFDVAAPPFLLHLSYRLYSMMLSSTLLGIIFSRMYRPRSWCAICPVGNLSNKLLVKNPLV